jgi:competence protein ComEC
MRLVAAIPALALLLGTATGVYAPIPSPRAWFVAIALAGWAMLSISMWRGRRLRSPSRLESCHGESVEATTVAFAPASAAASGSPAAIASAGGAGSLSVSWMPISAAALGFFGAAAALASDAADRALVPPVLVQSEPYRVDTAGFSATPLTLEGRIQMDASPGDYGATFTLDVDRLRVRDREVPSGGPVRIAVGGSFVTQRLSEWRAGRRVRVSALLSAPLPYRNIGVPDQETRLALAGIRLFGSVKTAAHVEVLARGHWWEEAAAAVRANVRHALARHVHAHEGRRELAARAAPDRDQHRQPADADGDTAATGAAASDSGTASDPASHSGTQAIGSARISGRSAARSPATAPAAAAPVAALPGAPTEPSPPSPASQSAAIVTAILIGDRAGLDSTIEDRLQRAGTFHIIAISGGNIAILTALVLGLLHLFGLPPRTCALLTLLVVVIYALIVGAGASVARATLAAVVYLFAKALDHRTPPLNMLAVVVGLMLVWAPLEVVDPGFWLTCLATLGIVLLTERFATSLLSLMRSLLELSEVTGALVRNRSVVASEDNSSRYGSASFGARVAKSAVTLLAATLAAEAVLLPISAFAFSQVTIAGLLLNFIAIPLMSVVQVVGLVVVACDPWNSSLAALAGQAVDFSARAIVESARLVDIARWTALRVAPPPLWLVAVCQACWAITWLDGPHRPRRRAAAFAWIASLGLIVLAPPLPSFTLEAAAAVAPCRMPRLPQMLRGTNPASAAVSTTASTSTSTSTPASSSASTSASRLSVTFLDVAQGDSTLVRLPDGRAWLVDTGGAIGRFDIGTRIVSPALWALGLRRLSTLVLTHGDRDHIGGASAVLRDLKPSVVWEGIPVEGHTDLARLRAEAQRINTAWRAVDTEERIDSDPADRSSHAFSQSPRLNVDSNANANASAADGVAAALDSLRVRVLNPRPAEWTRRRVRNDDSIVLEIVLGDVSLLLPGDVGPDAERAIAPGIAPIANVPPRIRILKAPHHGSRTSSTTLFLDALTPQIAIISAGRGNRHGHPAPTVLERYATRGATVFRTDRDGAIQLDTDGHTLIIRTCSGRLLSLHTNTNN